MQLVAFLEDHVVRLEVPVHDVLLRHVGQGLQDALHDLVVVEGGQVLLGGDVVEQLAALQQLHDQVDRVLGLVYFLQTHDVRVAQPLHHLDLVHDGLAALGLGKEVLLRKGLDRKGLLRLLVLDEVDAGEGALADHLDRVELRVEVALDEHARQVLLPLVEVHVVVAEQVHELHVADKTEAVVRAEGRRLEVGEVIHAHPLRRHVRHNRRHLLRVQVEDVVLRQHEVTLLELHAVL